MNDLADSLLLQSTTSRALPKLIPALKADLRSAGVWLRGSRDLSPSATDLDLEIHRHVVQSLYITLVRSGLHLSRSAHTALATLCSWDPPFTGRSIHLLLEVRSTPAVPHLPGPVSPISA